MAIEYYDEKSSIFRITYVYTLYIMLLICLTHIYKYIIFFSYPKFKKVLGLTNLKKYNCYKL